MRRYRSISLFILVAVILVLSLAINLAMAADPQAENAKRQLFEIVNQDQAIQRIVTELARDPQNQTLMDELLIRLPMSPLDMFRIRMESQIREYMIPKEVLVLHQRWLNLHPEAQLSEAMIQTLTVTAAANPYLEAVVQTVSTNRDVAATYSPAPADYQGEIQLSVNKNNVNQLVSAANTWDQPSGCDQTQAVFSSIDGGTSWRYVCAPSVAAFGMSCPTGNVVFGSDPAVFWDNNNTPFLNYMLLCCNASCQAGTANPTSSLVVAKSADTGLTWTGQGVIVNHLSGTSGGFDDKQFYAIDNTPSSPFYGRHYQCWDNNNNELFSYSTNGGVSWTQVDLPKGTTGDLDLGCEMAVGSNGTVHLIFDGLTCGTNCTAEKTYYARSTNGGVSWSTPVLIKNHNVISFHANSKIPAQDERGINPFGAIDIDNSGGSNNGRLYVAYSDATSPSAMSSSDVFVSTSSDNGATWSAGAKVNDDSTSTAQFHPFLAVDQTNGNVVVGWHDARNDSGNKRIDFYMSRSTNGGTSWEANTQVSQPSSEFSNNTISYTDESSNNAGNNPNQYGEYLGVDVHNGTAYMSWTDSRQFFPNNTGNSQKENLGFATVTFGASDTTPPTTSITAPAPGAVLSGTVTVSATASDNVGVTNVQFFANTTLIGSDSTSPYSISWDTNTVPNGSYNITSKAFDAAGNSGTSSPVAVTVSNTGGPPALTATYDSTLKAPACGSGGKSCDSGTSLLNSRGTMSPAEPNRPNTINSSCADGNSGTYHSDESLDRLQIATNDGTAFAGGKVVTATVTVWCWGTADKLDLYYTSTASTPSWTLINTQTCSTTGAVNFTASYTLPSSGTQHAIRGTFRYNGSASPCGTNSGYDDHDDLIFGVTQTADTTPPTTSITSPANGATVSGTITVSANASDNVGVTKVEFYLDGSTLLGTDTTSPYSISWNTTTTPNGSHNLTSKAYDAANNTGTSTPVNVTVNNTAPPPDLIATYSSTYKAPACPSGGKSCDSGATLLNGRGTMTNGIEPNHPNTINSSCTDGNSGTYHSDESLDRLKVSTNDGSIFAAGKAITITFTTYCYSSADKLDVYYTSNAASPTWTSLGTQSCTAAGVKTFTATYTLPSGANQAVRGNFRYNGSASSCSTGAYDDHDDLVFGVQ